MAHRPKLQLTRTVYEATDGPMQWRALEGIGEPETAEAVAYAVEMDWILARDGHPRLPRKPAECYRSRVHPGNVG